MLPRVPSCNKGLISQERKTRRGRKAKGPTSKGDGRKKRKEREVKRKGREGITPGPPTFQKLPPPMGMG